jgi:dihydropyrimidine dehydrogenase (NAD+) subunit PreA
MSSSNLSLNFAGLELKNPLIVTASDCSRTVRQLEEAEKCGASAVIIKAISLDPIALKSKPRFYVDKNSIFGFGGSKRLNTDEAEKLIKDAKKTVKIPIGVNIIYSKPADLDRYIRIAQKMQEAGVDFIEVNFFPATMKAPEGGNIPDLIYEGVKAVKQIADVPVMTKISPDGVDVVQVALAMERGGADAIHAIDAVSGSPMIDIYNEGKLLMQGTKNGVLWLSGEYLRPIAQANVIKVARAVKIPVLGTGGIMNWKHAVEMIMFGATATGLCTNLMIHGFEVLSEIERKIAEFMNKAGFDRIEDFKGLALKNMLSVSTGVEIIPVAANIDKDICNGCGLCVKPAHCGLERRAIRIVEGKAEVEREQCLGCGTCFYICPPKAICMA